MNLATAGSPGFRLVARPPDELVGAQRRGGRPDPARRAGSLAFGAAAEVESQGMTPVNERLLAKIHFIRERIFSAVRELEGLGVGPKDVPTEDFNAVGEAIGLLEGMTGQFMFFFTLYAQGVCSRARDRGHKASVVRRYRPWTRRRSGRSLLLSTNRLGGGSDHCLRHRPLWGTLSLEHYVNH